VWEIVAQSEPHTNIDIVDVGVLIRFVRLFVLNSCLIVLLTIETQVFRNNKDEFLSMFVVFVSYSLFFVVMC
jgi:hypothetical protein